MKKTPTPLEFMSKELSTEQDLHWSTGRKCYMPFRMCLQLEINSGLIVFNLWIDDRTCK
jgi:hypothetical protein